MNEVNNTFYETLGERWYQGERDPIALLRAEARFRNPWVAERIRSLLGNHRHRVLDVGCGGGLLSNFLSSYGQEVTAIDLSPSSIEVARQHDLSRQVQYEVGDAAALAFSDASFDVVCAMDVLEHVKDVSMCIREAGRVLRPGGLFFFYTFNRTFLSRLLAIKALEWWVPNTPPHLHVYRYFIRPKELRSYCSACGLNIEEMHGVKPVLFSAAAWRLAWHREVTEHFPFSFTPSLKVAYLGRASKGRA